MLRDYVIVWLINTFALLALPYLVAAVEAESLATAVVAAALLGLVNALIRPFIALLKLPPTTAMLGLFVFVINGLLFWFFESYVDVVTINGFWPAFFSAVIYALISWTASSLVLGAPRIVIVRRDDTR
jgi:putative membrane protein